MSRSSAFCRGRVRVADEARFDVLILGAGPAGCATALALLGRGIARVLVVDRAPPPLFIPGESATPDVAAVLRLLGLDLDPARVGARPYYGNVAAWGGPPALSLFGRRGQGWHLDRPAFERWLRAEMQAHGAVLACPARLSAIQRRADGWDVAVEGYGAVRARAVIDAGGRRAPLAKRLGAARRTLDRLVALAARAKAGGGSEGYSMIESFAAGWWYAAPLPSGEAIVMLMSDRDLAASFRAPRAFARAWHDTTELVRRVAAVPDDAMPRSFAAHGAFLEPAAGERWIAVGDALMAFDPLTSSGISGALYDGIAASAAIARMLSGEAAAAAYCARARRTRARYLAGHAAYYAMETRWPSSPFWVRRAGAPRSVSGSR